MTEVIFRSFLHLLKNHGRDFLGCVKTVIDGNAAGVVITFGHLVAPVTDFFGHLIEAAAHETLHGSNGIFRIGNGLALGRVTHFAFTIFQESHHRRGGSSTLFVGDHYRFITFHYSYAAVGGTQVNSDYFAHIVVFQ